jgi:catechol 2,3-dioxygenase-like lactoylglutathione lyase family enzyme
VELEESPIDFIPITDKRPLIPEPLPVRLLTVEDATLSAAAGLELQLDAFYIGLLKFERDDKADGLVYRADNFRLKFEIVEMRPDRESMRPLAIEVPLLAEVEHRFIEREMEYLRQKGITAGELRLMLRDPAGNWIEIAEYRPV